MCELLYFLQGAGRLIVDGDATNVHVHAGDSILAPSGSVQIMPDEQCHSQASAHVQDEGSPITFLRVVLPLSFVVQDSSKSALLEQCSCAAGMV
jgi:hypothetical protein